MNGSPEIASNGSDVARAAFHQRLSVIDSSDIVPRFASCRRCFEQSFVIAYFSATLSSLEKPDKRQSRLGTTTRGSQS